MQRCFRDGHDPVLKGLRVSEFCSLQWSSIEFETGTVYVRRAKGGQEATQHIPSSGMNYGH